MVNENLAISWVAGVVVPLNGLDHFLGHPIRNNDFRFGLSYGFNCPFSDGIRSPRGLRPPETTGRFLGIRDIEICHSGVGLRFEQSDF